MALSHLLRSAITTLVVQQPRARAIARLLENLAWTGLYPDSVATTSVSFVRRSACELWRLVEHAAVGGDQPVPRSLVLVEGERTDEVQRARPLAPVDSEWLVRRSTVVGLEEAHAAVLTQIAADSSPARCWRTAAMSRPAPVANVASAPSARPARGPACSQTQPTIGPPTGVEPR